MGGSSKGTTTSSYKPPQEILDAYKRAVQMAGGAASTPYTPYKGEMVAGLNPTQIAAIQNINNAQGMSLPYMGAATQMAQQAAYNYDPSRVGQYMSPYLQNVAQATQANILEQNAQQQQALKSGALQAGAFGGDRSGIAMGEMARQQGLAGAQTMSELYNTGYNNALQSMQQQTQNLFAGSQQMAGLGGSMLQQALQGAQAQMAAGGIQQTTQQAYDQAMYNQFLQQQAYPFQTAQFFANIAQGIGAGSGGTSTTTAPGPDPASMILGGLGSIASIWQASDERVKEDIEPVGKTYDGQNIYKFRYKGSPQTQMGLMAQEVEHKHPESVREFGGLKAVDYDKATKEAASMGGVVHPSMERQHFADGGLGMVPYEDFAEGYGGLSYVPKSKIPVGGQQGIPEAPKAYEEKGLNAVWDEIKGMNKEQLAKLKAGLGSIYSDVENYFTPDMISHASVLNLSSGGLARGHYENGGAPTNIIPQDDTQTETPTPTGLGLFLDRVYKNEGPGINKRDISPTGEVGTLRGHYESSYGKPFSEVTKEDVDALNKRWWDKVKAGDVEAKYGPKVAAAYADLSMTNPTAARKALEASGGDPDKFLGGMSEFYQKLAADKPEKFGVNLKGWLNRVNSWKDIGDFSANYDTKSKAVITPTADDSNAAAAHAGAALAQSQGKEEFGSPKHQRNLIETVLNRDLSDNAKQAILAASLALMGGRSPWLGVNLGEAGRVGMQMYYNTMAQERETAKLAGELGLKQQETRKAQIEADISSLNLDMQKMYLLKAAKGGDEAAKALYEERYGQISEGPNKGEISGKTKPFTMDYYQQQLKDALAGAEMFQATDPTKAAGFLAKAKEMRDAIDGIKQSPFYQNAQTMNAQYDIAKTNLQRLGEINAQFAGGRGSKQVADVVGLARKFGILDILPEGWQDDDAKYDEALKITTDMAIRDAQQSGLLKAPAAALEAESRIVPTPDMSPMARYNLVVKSLAILERNHDLYANWDTSPDTNQYVKDFTADSEHSLDKYISRAKEMIPAPAGTTNPPGQPVDDATARFLENRSTTANGGKAPPDGTKIKSSDGRTAVRMNGTWVWSE